MSINNPSSDQLAACIRQDRRAQRQLYEQYYSWAFNLCLRYATNHSEAEEMVNDGFLRVFKGLPSFRQESPFVPWMKRVIINTAINHLRKKRPFTEQLDQLSEPSVAPSGMAQLQYEDVLRTIQGLPPAYRAVFNLYEIEGYRHREIAQLLSISESSSRSNLLRAKTILKRRFQASQPSLNYRAS